MTEENALAAVDGSVTFIVGQINYVICLASQAYSIHKVDRFVISFLSIDRGCWAIFTQWKADAHEAGSVGVGHVERPFVAVIIVQPNSVESDVIA